MNIRANRLSQVSLSQVIAITLIMVFVGLGLNYQKDIIQFYNVKTLISEGLDGRLVAHRINHMDKLQAVLGNGIQSFEVDLTFCEDNGNTFFEIGHGKDDLSGLKFDQYLSSIKTRDVRKMWLDIKNVSE